MLSRLDRPSGPSAAFSISPHIDEPLLQVLNKKDRVELVLAIIINGLVLQVDYSLRRVG
jgi:hypothetical protein